MMTPKEVSTRSFSKATLGGYNLAQVDEFLDALTEDYSALFSENAILKNKLKVLSESVEEYRANESSVSRALLAAQQQADSIVAAAKAKRDELIGEAEQGAQGRIAELEKAIAAEEYRLRRAQESTAAYVRRLAELHDLEMEFLSGLGELVPPELAAQEQQDASAAIEAAVAAQVLAEETAEEAGDIQEEEAGISDETAVYTPVAGPGAQPDDIELDPDATRRFSDMKFGKDYKIE